MADSPVTLWECIERCPRPFSRLKTYLLHLGYPSGWAVYDRLSWNERWSCPLTQATCAPKPKQGRDSLNEAAERKMMGAAKGGAFIESPAFLDMYIADAYILIAKQWGFNQRETAVALGKAAAVVLGRFAPDGRPLGGERIKQLAELSPLIDCCRARLHPRECIARFRPEAIRGYTKADLDEVCTKVLACRGQVPREWEDFVIF